MTAGYRTSVDALQAVLPGTLRADRDHPDVAVWTAEFATAGFETRDGQVQTRPSYLQGGVSVRCLRAGRPGAYALLTFIEGLNHGLLGRELFGLPKKQAQQVYLDDHLLLHLQAYALTPGGITPRTSSTPASSPPADRT